MPAWLCAVTSDLSAGSMGVRSTGARMMVGVVVGTDVLDVVCDMPDETYDSLFGSGMVCHTVLVECGYRYHGGVVG